MIRSPVQNVEAEKDVDMTDSLTQAGQRPPVRLKCYDYHGRSIPPTFARQYVFETADDGDSERGYCMRGVSCPYEHSDDVIIPTPDMMFPQFPFAPLQSGRGGRGRGRGRGGFAERGRGNGFGHPVGAPPGYSPFGPPGFSPMIGMPVKPFTPRRPSPPPNDSREDFSGSSKPPVDRSTTTLVITDIPAPSLSVQAIREYFARFGEVTNIALESSSRRALISFGSNAEAYAAWKADEAVFGSRHVRVLWHRPRPGQGAAGQIALEKSRDLMANMKALENGSGPQGEVKASLSGPESRLAATLAELDAREKGAKRETMMAEQKVLLKRAKEGSKEEKVLILKRLKAISKEMESLDKPKVEEGDEGMGGKERLDRELEKHGMETNDQEELMRLSAQLSALRDKVSFC